VSCLDPAGRPRTTTVVVKSKVVLTVAPGEIARYDSVDRAPLIDIAEECHVAR
jgi:hypothetical protein